MASLELLDALSTGANTVTTVATALGISRAEAARQLSAATAGGLVGWVDDDSHLTHLDAGRRFARLSTAGLEELARLQEAAAGRCPLEGESPDSAHRENVFLTPLGQSPPSMTSTP
jgi:DNA-binding IclR family transcriptional regulator